jgi:hypothetical protein
MVHFGAQSFYALLVGGQWGCVWRHGITVFFLIQWGRYRLRWGCSFFTWNPQEKASGDTVSQGGEPLETLYDAQCPMAKELDS